MGWIHKRLIPGERRAHAANKRSRGRGGEGRRGGQFITCKWYVGNCTLEKHIQALLGNIPVSKCCLQTYFSIMVILSKKQRLYCIVNKKLSCTNNCFAFLCVLLCDEQIQTGLYCVLLLSRQRTSVYRCEVCTSGHCQQSFIILWTIDNVASNVYWLIWYRWNFWKADAVSLHAVWECGLSCC